MTIHELEHFLSHSPNNPLVSFQSIRSLIPDNLEVCEHILEDGKLVEMTLDRDRAKMILEVYRDGDMIGEPINFFYRPFADALLGSDWLELKPLEIIHRVLEREESLRDS